MKAEIVVGLGYGDEGKGTTVDFLCGRAIKQGKNPIVVRFSGGPQAGHTTYDYNEYHIHSSFGSGTHKHNTATFFSKHTLVYPISIKKEMCRFKVKPTLYIDPMANLITPFDVMANRECKVNLSDGSCGLGIGKAMARQNDTPFKFYAIDLAYPKQLYKKMRSYARYYNIDLTEKALNNEIREFTNAVNTIDWRIYPFSQIQNMSYDHVIFEGSQGILLDKDHGVFPNVTYANTTSKNAVEMIKDYNLNAEDIYYVTRAYSTRHGNGLFKEDGLKVNNDSESNRTNEYQGKFKISNINYANINYALDIDRIYTDNKIAVNLVVTCLDQIPEDFEFEYKNIYMHFKSIYNSVSPDSRHFELLKNK